MELAALAVYPIDRRPLVGRAGLYSASRCHRKIGLPEVRQLWVEVSFGCSARPSRLVVSDKHVVLSALGKSHPILSMASAQWSPTGSSRLRSGDHVGLSGAPWRLLAELGARTLPGDEVASPGQLVPSIEEHRR